VNTAEIDREALGRLLRILGDDVAELEDLRNDYMEDAPALARRISEAVSQGDWYALKIAAHTLKSNARDFGASRLADLCNTLEHACDEGRPEDPQGIAECIRREEEAAREALSKICLDRLQSGA